MNRLGRATVLGGMGTLALRLVVNGEFGFFVQQHMKLPLLAAACALLALTVVECFRGVRESVNDEHDRSSRRVSPRVGALFVLPGVVLMLVAPTGLGSAALDRLDTTLPAADGSEFAPLDPGTGPVEMKMADFIERAVFDEGASLDDVPVVLEGFITHDDALTDGFRLTRFLISCCAADAMPLQVAIHTRGAVPAEDLWVRVTGTWRRPVEAYDTTRRVLVEFDATTYELIPEPRSPYESTW